MEHNNALALIVAYYLSRFDSVAYNKLEMGAQSLCHQQIGQILEVNPNSVKNMRDEFDSVHDNPRVGWHQRPLRPSRLRVLESLQDLDEVDVYEIVLEILTDPDFNKTETGNEIIESIVNREKTQKSEKVFISRGPTGKKAEQIFQEAFKLGLLPFEGELSDKRDFGCGFDFEVNSIEGKYAIEVKGLDGENGGVSFTSKEWDVARKMKEDYFLAIVKNISNAPYIYLIQSPADFIKPKKHIFTSVQVRWNVSENGLPETAKHKIIQFSSG